MHQENQYSSTIILTGDDITCITHVFNVLAEDEINLLAGQQNSSITMDKDQIAVQSPMILENAKTLLKMDAAMIMENCKASAGGGVGGIAGKLASIGGKLAAVAQNVTQNISNALANSGLNGALNNAMQGGLNSLGGLGNLGGLTQGLSNNFMQGLNSLSSFNNVAQGLGGAGDILGKTDIGNALQQSLSQAGNTLGQITSSVSNQVQSITNTVTNNIQQGMQTINKATQTVHETINQGTQALGGAINNATQGITGAVQKIGSAAQQIVSNTIGQAESLINKATSGVSLPSIDNLPIMHINANDISIIYANDNEIEINNDKFIQQQYQIIYNYVYNMNLNEEEEKQQLYIYYITLYNYTICLDQLSNVIICDFPINFAALYLLNVYMQDVQDYTNNINLIVQDYINNTSHFTIKQIIHDQNDKRIKYLQIQESLRQNVKNDIIKNEVIKLINQYIEDYIELTNNLITLTKELSTIKIDLDEKEIINEDNEFYDLL